MPQPTVSLTDFQTFAALRSFLLAILPPETAVVKAQVNRVPEPIGSNFVVMTPLLRERLETNVNGFVDGALLTPVQPGVNNILTPMKVTIQLDVHGPSSAENAQVIVTLFRSEWGVDQFQTSGFDVTPLYTGEPNQLPFDNGEQQIEQRWSIDAVLQCNPIIQVPQDFAASLEVNLKNIDVYYPPT
jgi:hypothetical protein